MKITTPDWLKLPQILSPLVGQENQFASTRGLRYGPLRINKTGIFVNNGTLDSTIINSTGFHGYGLTGTEQLTLDSATGVNVTDGTSSVFKVEISGTGIGDVTLGDYGNGYGVKYDKSVPSFTIKGALAAGTIDIGGADSTSFHVNSGGDIWAGAATFDTATNPFSVTNAGVLRATGAIISGTITATAGTIGGWTVASTTLTGGDVLLDSSGGIRIGSAAENVTLLTSAGVPYVSFMSGSAVMGLLTSTTVGSGGVRVVGGDLALDNTYSILIKGTGTEYAAFSVDGSNNTIIESSDGDNINFQDHNGASMMGLGTSNCYWPNHTLQLKEISEPSNPGTDNTGLIFIKDNGGGKSQLCVRFRTGVTQVIATEP